MLDWIDRVGYSRAFDDFIVLICLLGYAGGWWLLTQAAYPDALIASVLTAALWIARFSPGENPTPEEELDGTSA